MWTNHDIVEIVPRQSASLGDHCGRNQWCEHSSKSVECMQEPEDLVWILHVTHPGIPSRVGQSISKTGYHENDDEHRVWWVNSDNDVGENMASRGNDGHASLSPFQVNGGVKEC